DAAAVVAPGIGLDREPLGAPEEVHFPAPDLDVHLRWREAEALAEREKVALQVAARAVAMVRGPRANRCTSACLIALLCNWGATTHRKSSAVRHGAVTGIRRRLVRASGPSEGQRWMRMPGRGRRPSRDGIDTSIGPCIGRSSSQRAAALRWLSTAPGPQVST